MGRGRRRLLLRRHADSADDRLLRGVKWSVEPGPDGPGGPVAGWAQWARFWWAPLNLANLINVAEFELMFGEFRELLAKLAKY